MWHIQTIRTFYISAEYIVSNNNPIKNVCPSTNIDQPSYRTPSCSGSTWLRSSQWRVSINIHACIKLWGSSHKQQPKRIWLKNDISPFEAVMYTFKTIGQKVSISIFLILAAYVSLLPNWISKTKKWECKSHIIFG